MPGNPVELSPQLDQLVSGYGAMVQAIGRRRGLDEADLDEVMQDVRIRLWKALGSSERIGRVNTSYVYQAAMSAVCDLIRRRRGDRTESIEDRPETPIVDSLPGPDVGYERRELAQEIGRALDQLGADQRPVVRMYLAGYPQGEIQALLGWTEAKTRNVLYRGLTQLRLGLGRTGIGPHATR
jgi:RNA polymerase sigma factor (sigma-70 family)